VIPYIALSKVYETIKSNSSRTDVYRKSYTFLQLFNESEKVAQMKVISLQKSLQTRQALNKMVNNIRIDEIESCTSMGVLYTTLG
jgi:hypothetical protein